MRRIANRAMLSLLAVLALAGCWDHRGRGHPGHPGDRPHHHDHRGTGYDQGLD